MMATFQGDVLLTAFFFNNLTGTGRTSAVLRLECSLDCISGSVGHQQNIFRSFSHCRPIPGPLTKLRYNLPAIF